MTRKQAIWNYDSADNFGDLFDVYGTCSAAKRYAMDYCKRLQRERNGYDGRITSHNTFQFSYGFRFLEDGIEKLMYITKAHDRVFDY